MKFIYFTSQKYPSAKADPFFVKSMALAFDRILGQSFLFVVRGNIPAELEYLHTISVNMPKHFRTALYFFRIPFLVISNKWNNKMAVFFSSDPYLLSALIFWRKILGFKYVVCSDWHQLFDDWRDRYVATHSDFLITTSKRLKSLLVSVCKISPEKVLVAYGGVDKDIFDAKFEKEDYRAKLGLPKGVFLVGYVGGFRCMGMDKGVITMIKSLPFLDKNVKMVFVGAVKREIDEYEIFAEKEGVKDRCIFIRKQPFEKVIEYEMAMSALVIPYPDKPHFRDYGFPMKVWEYMASGRPIIYSNLEIIKEVLDGRASSFEPDNPQSLAGTITSVINDAGAAKVVAVKSFKEVENYTWQVRANKIIAFVAGHFNNTNNEKERIINLFYSRVSAFEKQMRYAASEKNKIKRVVHNIKELGIPYIFYSMQRFGVAGFLKNIKADLFFGKRMILPAKDIGASVFSMYGIMPHKSERKLALWFMKNLTNKDIFYDIGAHFGYYTALAERVLKDGEIHSFEANGKLCEYLKRNFLNSGNIFISRAAVSDSSGEVDFYDATDIEDSSMSSRFRIKEEYINPIKVPAIALDEYVDRENRPPSIIKLDIEGGEEDAIIGARSLIEKYRPGIIMEVWGGKYGDIYSRPAIARLKKLGYKAFSLDADGNVSEKETSDPIMFIGSGHDGARDNFLFEYQQSNQ